MEEQKTNEFKERISTARTKVKNFIGRHKKVIAIGATAATALGLAYYKGRCDAKDEEIKLDLDIKLIPSPEEKVETEPTEEPAEETEEEPEEKTYVMRFFDEETGEEYRPNDLHWRCGQEYVDDTMDSVPGD